jgi:hypothetical protein
MHKTEPFIAEIVSDVQTECHKMAHPQWDVLPSREQNYVRTKLAEFSGRKEAMILEMNLCVFDCWQTTIPMLGFNCVFVSCQ